MQQDQQYGGGTPHRSTLLGIVAGIALCLYVFCARRLEHNRANSSPDHANSSPDTADARPPLDDTSAESTFEWLKAEYGALIKHFEEVWKSGAQNFSYMAVASAAILTFGSNRLRLEITFLLAWMPLAIWFLVTYLPFSLYGHHLRQRLRCIEEAATLKYGINEGHFLNWDKMISQETSQPRTGYIATWLLVAAMTVAAFLPITAKILGWKDFNRFFENSVAAPERSEDTRQQLSRVEADMRDIKAHLQMLASPRSEDTRQKLSRVEANVRDIKTQLQMLASPRGAPLKEGAVRSIKSARSGAADASLSE
jgi:hypothetical protein